MAFQSKALNRSTSVDPEKWLGMLQRWHPRMPREELVDFLNQFIEAAGLQRVEGLDALFVHVDKTTRSAQEKLDKLRHWTKKMRSNPLFWPQLFERDRPVSVLIKKIVDESPRPVARRDVERKFRKYRKIPSTGLTQELRELANRGEIDRLKLGLYWHRGTASAAYESEIQRMYRLVYSAPDHRLREAELAVALGLSRGDTGSRVSNLRKRGLFAPATGNGVVVASSESLATLQQGPIFDGRGGIFFEVERAATLDVTFADGGVHSGNRAVPLGEAAQSGDIVVEDAMEYGDLSKQYAQQTFGAHYAEVGVDAATGEIRVRRMLAVCAAGRILNPKTARSQVIGGMTMGAGAALMEEMVVDKRLGFFVNHDLAGYEVPVHADIPHQEVIFLDEVDPTMSPMKAKGVGELGLCGVAGAIANAVYNATGVRVRDYPITLDKFLDRLPDVA